MPSSNFLSQVDATSYTPTAPADVTTPKKTKQIGRQESNNRSEYLNQLNDAIQQKPPEKTSRKNQSSAQQTERPVESKTQVEPKQNSPEISDHTEESASQNNAKKTEIQQTDAVTTNTEAEQTELQDQSLINFQNESEAEVPAPPVHIEELFQQEALPEESKGEQVDTAVKNLEPVVPPTGLVVALNLVESDHLDATPQKVETNAVDTNQTLSVTESLTIQSNVSEGEQSVIPTEAPPEIQTEKTEPVTVDKPLAVDVTQQEQTVVEAVSVNEPLTTPTKLVSEQPTAAPVILPFTNLNKDAESDISQENEDQQNQNLTDDQPQEKLTVQQPVTKLYAEPSISSAAENNEPPFAQSADQEAIHITSNSKKITVTQKPANQPETSTPAPPSVPFSEVPTEGATTNISKNATTTQSESIRDQTISAVETSVEQGQSLSIRLTPPELGTIQIQLTIEDGVISARLEVQTPEAHNALMQHLQSLQESLQQSGTPVENLTIQMTPQTSEDQAAGDSGRSDEQQSDKEQNEKNQEQDKSQQEQEEQQQEPKDGDQLNIAA